MDFTAMRNGWVAPDPKMMGGIATWIGIGGGAAGNSMPAQQNNMTSQGVNQAAHDPDLDKMFFDMIAELDPNKRLEIGTRSSRRPSRCTPSRGSAAC